MSQLPISGYDLFPDEAALGLMATEMLAALGGGATPGLEIPDVPGASIAPTAPSAGGAAAPSIPGPPAAPQAPSGPSIAGTPAVEAQPSPATPAPPVTPPAQTLPVTYEQATAPAASASEFYFLEEISQQSTSVVPPAMPTTPGYVDLTAYLPASVDSVPQVPGVPTSASPSSFYFLDGGSAASAPSAGPNGALSQAPAGLDARAVRGDFPILAERVNGHQLIWFDNAATTQKPQSVIDRLAYYYAHENSNIHRSAHTLAARSTDAYENARQIAARFIGAGSTEEIVFVRGTTEAINLVANSWGRKNLREGDEIIISNLEHHANIVPWQFAAQATGAVIKVIPVNDRGELLLDEYQNLLSDRTKIVSVTQVSNALGTVTPVEAIVDLGHRAGAKVLIDGAQSVAHTPVDVAALGADFFVFSGHKIYGPTGIGVLYGRRDVLEDMPPWQGGGNMIADVTFERSVFQPPPGRFEAGTGNIADAVGLGEALEYVERIGLPVIAAYEHELLAHATEGMLQIPGLRIFGTAREKASVLSFTLDGYEPTQVGQALNELGIAVRAGHHCAQPILRRFGVETTVRASLAFYNTIDEVDYFVAALRRLAADAGNR